MYEPYENKKNSYPLKILVTVCLLLTAVQAQKNKKITLSHGPKTPLVACVFYLVLICTCFWLNVNSYTIFWHLPIIPPFFSLFVSRFV